MTAGEDVSLVLPAFDVEPCSAVGAGDSFLAGLVLAFARGEPPEQVLRQGLAAGAAAVLSCGSDLAQKADIDRLLEQIPLA